MLCTRILVYIINVRLPRKSINNFCIPCKMYVKKLGKHNDKFNFVSEIVQ